MASELLAVQAVEARHQAVREFVEARYPGKWVRDIRESSRTSYQPFTIGGKPGIVRIEAEYVVEMIGAPETNVMCYLLPLEDGTLRVSREEFSLGI